MLRIGVGCRHLRLSRFRFQHLALRVDEGCKIDGLGFRVQDCA